MSSRISKFFYHPLRVLSLGWLLLWGQLAQAGGFQINEHSASATGQANSVVATINNPSAIYHNPAGLTETQGTQFLVGLTTIFAVAEYRGPGLPGAGGPTDGQNISSSPSFVPHVYASHAVSERLYIGLGFYSPFGSRVEWEDADEFVGRTQSRRIGLQTSYFTPTVALKLSKNLSIAAGISLIPAVLLIERSLGDPVTQAPLFSDGGLIEIGATAFGIGASAGIQWTILDHLRLGFSYRSAVELGFEGDANFTLPESVPSSLRSNFPDQTGNGDLTLPHSLAVGAGWSQGPFSIELGAQWTLWESYDELTINFDAELPAKTSTSPRNWENALILRVGGSYQLGNATVRAGIAYDFSPMPDETIEFTIPSNDRINSSLGGGYAWQRYRIDLSYLASYALERSFGPNVSVNIPAGGTYSSALSHVISLSAGVQL
ncbi:MAG: outer membrane protein transport protein [Myxococcales bacterium]|nr:outer membrane protein transport protein [Myxococcales bacterium]